MTTLELIKAHSSNSDGAWFAWRAREKQSEGERARNGWSSDVASLFTPLWLDQLGQHWRMATTWWPWPGMGPLTAWSPWPSVSDEMIDNAISSTSIS